jgi:hypothetical protein
MNARAVALRPPAATIAAMVAAISSPLAAKRARRSTRN